MTIATACVAALSGAMLLGTAGFLNFWYGWSGDWASVPLAYKVMNQLNLASEDVVAAWFSSMLLAGIAWLAIICFLRDGQAKPRSRLRFGWVVIALGFVALSFDELGSAHERLQLPDTRIGTLIWYAPILAILPAYMLLFAWFRMRRKMLSVVLIACGAALFASVPLQEYVEVGTKAVAGAGWQRPIGDVLLEEGAELAGMLCFLVAFAIYALEHGETAPPAQPIRMELSPRPTAAVCAALLAVAIAGLYLAPRLLIADGKSGTPQNWFPAALAFLAALMMWHIGSRRIDGRRIASVAIAVASLVVSAYVGGNLHGWGNPLLKSAVLLAVAIAGTASLVTRRNSAEAAVCLFWAAATAVAVAVLPSDHIRLALTVASAALILLSIMPSAGLRLTAGQTPRALQDQRPGV
jgi:hypothetical protein